MRCPVRARWFWRMAAGAGILGLASGAVSTQSRWWMDEPIRFLQTNLSETDSTLDPKALVAAVADFPANTFLFNMGGIVAQYPTRVPFHYPSPFLPPGRDLFGDVRARGARARHSRGRPLRSEQDAEAGLRRASGMVLQARQRRAGDLQRPLLGLHQRRLLPRARAEDPRPRRSSATRSTACSSTCSATRRPTTAACRWGRASATPARSRFRARYGRPLPAAADADYRAFMADSAREVAATIARADSSQAAGAAFLTYIQDHTDGIMSESNTAVGRALPLWPYSASDNVNRARNSEPDKMAINLSMSFVDYPWRYVTRAAGGDRSCASIRTWRTAGRRRWRWSGRWTRRIAAALIAAQAGLPVARGARGSLRRPAERGARAAAAAAATRRRIAGSSGCSASSTFRSPCPTTCAGWTTASRRLRSRDRAEPARRRSSSATCATAAGCWSRATTPPRVADRPRRRPAARDAGRLADSRSHRAAAVAEGHGSALPRRRVRRAAPPLDRPLLTLIPPAMFGPPEKVWVDKVETTIPGLVVRATHGKGPRRLHPVGRRRPLLPPQLAGARGPDGRRDRSPAAGRAAVEDRRASAGRDHGDEAAGAQAHAGAPRQRQRALGHGVLRAASRCATSASSWRGRSTATAVGLNRSLPVTSDGRYRSFTLPSLKAYEVVVME